MSKYEAVLTCGVCKKKTPLTDEQTDKILGSGEMDTLGICSCGKTWKYNDTIRCKMLVDTKDWRVGYGHA